MRDRIASWKAAFEDEDQGVLHTLINLAWDLAAFDAFVGMVRGAPDDEDGKQQVNPLIFHLVNQGFWLSAFMAIRRLLDRGAIRGPDGVCSLRAIVNDARAARGRLTRRAYVEDISGVPYNYEVTRRRQVEFAEAQDEAVFWVPRDLWPETSHQRHVEFDWLAGVGAGESRDSDLIREEIFDRLDARLNGLEAIAEHATVHFAHAATQASREGRMLEGFNLGEVKDALRVLTQTAELVGRWFCFTGTGDVLPTAQFDQFAYLYQPLFPADANPLREAWERFADEVGEWPRIENDDL